MKLWLDDIRPAPVGWVHVRSVNDARNLLENNTVTEASLDHDLGDYAADGGDAWRLVDWMAEQNVWPTESFTVHSANPIGSRRMLETAGRYGPYAPAHPMSRTLRAW